MCVSLPKTKRSESNRCPDNDKYYVLDTFGLDIGTCCASNLAGAAWNVSTPACALVDNSLIQAHDVIRGESDRTFDVAGLKVCVSQPKHVKRDELYCPGGDEWFELENDEKTYGFCCGSNSVAATWNKMYGPQCCGDNDEACKGRAISVKGCPSGWDKQLLRGRVTTCKKD